MSIMQLLHLQKPILRFIKKRKGSKKVKFKIHSSDKRKLRHGKNDRNSQSNIIQIRDNPINFSHKTQSYGSFSLKKSREYNKL